MQCSNKGLGSCSAEHRPCTYPVVPLPLFAGEAERHVSEVIYIPIFDRGPCAAAGVVAVMEVLVSSQAHDYMVVANAISCCGHLLDALQVSHGCAALGVGELSVEGCSGAGGVVIAGDFGWCAGLLDVLQAHASDSPWGPVWSSKCPSGIKDFEMSQPGRQHSSGAR